MKCFLKGMNLRSGVITPELLKKTKIKDKACGTNTDKDTKAADKNLKQILMAGATLGSDLWGLCPLQERHLHTAPCKSVQSDKSHTHTKIH